MVQSIFRPYSADSKWLVPVVVFLCFAELKTFFDMIDAFWPVAIPLSVVAVSMLFWTKERVPVGHTVFVTGIIVSLGLLFVVWSESLQFGHDTAKICFGLAVIGAVVTGLLPCMAYRWVVVVFTTLMTALFWKRMEFYEVVLFIGFAAWWFAALRNVRSSNRKPGVLPSLLFFGAATLLPIKHGRFVALTDEERVELRNQLGLETLFLREDPRFPRFRMEMFCEVESGVTVVTPHAPSGNATLMHPDGRTQKIPLGGQAPDHSSFGDGQWYTTNGHEFLRVDLSTGEIVSRAPCCEPDVYYIHRRPRSDVFYVARQRSDSDFVEVHLEDGTPRVVREVQYGADEFIPVDERRMLMSAPDRIAWVETTTGLDIRSIDLTRNGLFFEIIPDFENNTLYAPEFEDGVVYVLDADTLRVRGQFDASPGVRGVLVDPDDPGRVFSYNYASGEVREHRMPSGETVRTWTLGPILRALNWDCGHEALLGATSQGGYRIWLDMASSGR